MTEINSLIKTFKKYGDDYMLDEYSGADVMRGIEAPKSIDHLFTYTDKNGCGVYYNWVLKVPYSNGVLFFVLKNGTDEAAVIINLKSDETFEVLEDDRLCEIS